MSLISYSIPSYHIIQNMIQNSIKEGLTLYKLSHAAWTFLDRITIKNIFFWTVKFFFSVELKKSLKALFPRKIRFLQTWGEFSEFQICCFSRNTCWSSTTASRFSFSCRLIVFFCSNPNPVWRSKLLEPDWSNSNLKTKLFVALACH